MRPLIVAYDDARRAFTELRQRDGSDPSVGTFAAALGVSRRTAYRYLHRLRLRATCCPRCRGRGWVRPLGARKD